MKKDKGIGLVLSGGGAKGAYEIGVMKALDELNIVRLITGISGSSVGALNAALFSIGDTKRIIDIWENVKQSDFTYTDLPSSLNKISRTLLIGIPLEILPILYPFSLGFYSARKIKLIYQIIINIYGGLFSQKGIHSIIDKNNILRDELYRNYEIYTTTYNASTHRTEYRSWRHKSPEEVKQIMLASANMPFVYPPSVKRNGFKLSIHLDGGIGDNTPIKPLYDIGYREFIVVYMKKIEKVNKMISKRTNDFPNAIFYDISPDDNFNDGILHTVIINKERIHDLINQGYHDTLFALRNGVV